MRPFLKTFTAACLLAASSLSYSTPVTAQQSAKNVMVVFDGSGSMWGQINGRTKIEIARDTLSSVLEEVDGSMKLGMIAYGHRQKGQCSDIETVVSAGPARSTVPAMIDAANAISPKGKTPLSDAVRMAAEELRYTEDEATVILVTDGLETCNADPCALANELEKSGINFTAHVVGFGLSREDGRKVACLAENTGGQYFSADDASGLGNALKKTLAALPQEDDFEDEPVSKPRNVQLILRDAKGTARLTTRKVKVSPVAGGSLPWPDNFKVFFEGAPYTASGTFEPGEYNINVVRDGDGSGKGYTATTSFTVEEGEGIQQIELVLSARLKIVPYLSASEPFDKKNPPLGGVKSNAWLYLAAFPVQNGVIAEKPSFSGAGVIENAVPPGLYVIRGEIDRLTSREKLVEVKAGETTTFQFDMDVARVYINALQDGKPVKRQTTFFYDKVPKGRNYWRRGHGGKNSKNGQNNPFYLAPGKWIVNVGNEGGGKRRSVIVVTVNKPGEEIRLDVPEGQVLSEQDKAYFESANYQGCLAFIGAKFGGCLVEQADLTNKTTVTRASLSKPQSNTIVTQQQSGSADLPAQDVFRSFSGVFASVGFNQSASGDELKRACEEKPLVLNRSGVLSYKRKVATGFVTDEVRFCKPHGSGEIDCLPAPVSADGSRIDVSNMDANAPLISLRGVRAGSDTAETCLAGPDGRDGPRLCTFIKQCTPQFVSGLGQKAQSSLLEAPKRAGN